LSQRSKSISLADWPQVLVALWHLALYDAVSVFYGMRGVKRLLRRTSTAWPSHVASESTINALDYATCFYLRPVRCLQRSVTLARLLRRNGISAEVIVGYRWEPFCGHAWVEVEGRPIDDFAELKKSMSLFMTFGPDCA
jgi:hypothetical protein